MKKLKTKNKTTYKIEIKDSDKKSEKEQQNQIVCKRVGIDRNIGCVQITFPQIKLWNKIEKKCFLPDYRFCKKKRS